METIEGLETRVRELEELSSHQEHLVRELNQTVFELRTEIDRLGTLFRKQQETLESISQSSGGDAPAHDPPPHY